MSDRNLKWAKHIDLGLHKKPLSHVNIIPSITMPVYRDSWEWEDESGEHSQITEIDEALANLDVASSRQRMEHAATVVGQDVVDLAIRSHHE